MVYRASAYINTFLKPTKNKGNECWRLLRSSSLILHSKVKIADIKFTDLIIIFHLSLSLSSSPFSAGWTHHLYGWIYIQNDQVHAILSIIISSKYYNYLSRWLKGNTCVQCSLAAIVCCWRDMFVCFVFAFDSSMRSGSLFIAHLLVHIWNCAWRLIRISLSHIVIVSDSL